MRSLLLASLVALSLPAVGTTAEPGRSKLRVLYVGSASTPRGQAYVALLRQHFTQADGVERVGFEPKQAEPFDVVVLDWSQQDRPREPMSPFGPRESWNKPTVLLGSAGLLLGEAWEIHGTIG